MVASHRLRRLSVSALILALVAVLAVAGCGSQGSGTVTTAGAGGGGTTSGSTGAGVPSGATTVAMKNIAFVPPEVTIKVGQIVAWVNEDSVQHDVVASDGSFRSPLLDKNRMFTFTFTNAGSFAYYCAIRPQMKGTVTVEP
jgi:plastocyanin